MLQAQVGQIHPQSELPYISDYQKPVGLCLALRAFRSRALLLLTGTNL